MKSTVIYKILSIFILTLISDLFFTINVTAQTYLVNSGMIVLSGTNTQLTLDNLTNNSGGNLNLNGGSLNIGGSFSNNGSYDGTGTIMYNGSSQQTLTGITVLNNLTINNSNGVLLSGDITVNNNVTLANGVLALGSYNLTLNNTATISGSFSQTRMINASGTGQLIKKFSSTGSFTYPIGDNLKYSPATVEFKSGTFAEGAYLGANVKNIKHPNNSSLNDYINRYWVMNQSGISSFSYGLTLQYNTSDVTGNEASLYLGKYNGSIWTIYNQADIVNHTLSLSNGSSFSEFTGGQQSAMPVELLNFCSSVIGRDVNLEWTTVKEENNTGFKIERTVFTENNELWEQIGFINGKGSPDKTTVYKFRDYKLSAGKYKYRLKQIDCNGNITVFNLKGEIEILKPVKYSLSQNYPNPFNPITKIDFELPVDDKVSLKIYDITGRNVLTIMNKENKIAGFYTLSINASMLSSGIYFYRLETGKFAQVKKMIIVK